MALIPSQINIVVADDHPLMLSGLVTELNTLQYNIVATAVNGAQALEKIIRHQPHIAIIDIEMPIMSGFEVVKCIDQQCPNTAFVIMSYHKEMAMVLLAKQLDIKGYLLKEDSIHDMNDCIEAVLNDRVYFSRSFQMGIEDELEDEIRRIKNLTATERTIVRLVAKGLNSSSIAETLLISPRTVQKHRSNIIAKLRLDSSPEHLVRWAKEHVGFMDEL